MLVSEKISGWGTAVRSSSHKKYLLLFLAITLTFGIFLSIPKEAFGIGFPNKATANSDNGVYHAKGKEHRLQVVVPGGATAEDWSFCINEGKGTPVYTPPPNEYSYGDFTRIDNATADQLYNEYGRNHANNGALAFHQLPNNVTKDQFYSQVRKLIYIFSQDPTKIIEQSGLKDLGNLAENGFWNVIQKIIYEYTEGKTYTENSFTNAAQKKAFTQVKELIQKDEKDIIPEHMAIQIRVYKAEPIGGSWTKGVQSLVTGRILPKYPVYFSKQIFKAGITQDELIANATGEKGLSGAKFHIKDSNDKELVFDNGQVLEWTSNKDPQGVLIDPGKYSLVEVEAPQGYEPLDDIHFTLNHDGTISLEESDRVKKISYQGDVINDEGKATGEKETRHGLAVLNKKIEENSYQVKIAKVHQVGTEIQARTGARLELLKDGQHLDYWNTLSAPTRFNLKEGTYTIKEVRAPYGYKKLESEIQFTVGSQGKVTVTKGNDVASVSENSTIQVMNKKEPTIGTSAQIQQRGTDIGKEFTYATATQPGSLAVRDSVSYSGFEDGSYVAIAELIKGHDDTKVIASAFSPFEVKDGKDTGSADVFIPLKTDDISVGQNSFTVLERVYKAQDVEYEGADGATPVAKVKGNAQPVAVHVEKDDQDQTVIIKVVETKFVVNFWKTDQEGNKLPGARLKITDKNGKDLSGKIWTSLKDRATPVTLPAGEYILKELAAPEGYSTLLDKTFTIDANGTLTFDDPAGIKVETDADKDIFTVYVENKKKHNNPDGELATTVSVDGVKASVDGGVRVTSARAGAGVDVMDTIAYTGLVAGEKYSVSGSLFEVADGRTVGDAKAVKTEEFTASDTGAGEWTVDFGRVAGLEPGKQYVVFETATSVKNLVDTDGDDEPDVPQVEKHEDPNDASQTVVVNKKHESPKGKLATTVSVDGVKASVDGGVRVTSARAGAGVDVMDTIAYTGLVAGEKYSVSGSLFEVADGRTVGDAKAVKTEEFTASDTGAGEWTVDFGRVAGLEPGKQYVVFETATSVKNLVDTDGDDEPDVPQVEKHEDPNDASQTVVVNKKHESPKGKLATTVSVDGVKASVDGGVRVTSARAGAGVDVMDTIAYTGLVAGEKYSVSGSLFEVADGRTVGDAKAVKTEEFTASDTGAGEWTVDFGRVAGLEPGKQYVVFETATSVKNLVDTDGDDEPDVPQVEKHEDPNDASQTVVVNKKHESPKGKLATTVSVDGVKASVDGGVRVTSARAGAGVDVMDTIAYTGLVAGEKYSVSGSLFEVADGRTVGDAKAVKTEEFTASDTGAGEWTVDFGRVAGLEPGKQYVVFETATSVKNLVDTDGDDEPDVPQVEKHEDPNDASQTVVVEETPKKPNMANTGATGIGAILGAALFACLAGAGMRLSARRRSKVALS